MKRIQPNSLPTGSWNLELKVTFKFIVGEINLEYWLYYFLNHIPKCVKWVNYSFLVQHIFFSSFHSNCGRILGKLREGSYLNFLLGFLVISGPHAMSALLWGGVMGVSCPCGRCSLSPTTSVCADISGGGHHHHRCFDHQHVSPPVSAEIAGPPLALDLHDPQSAASGQDLPHVWTCVPHHFF